MSQNYIKKDHIKKNKEILFIFSDNDERKGLRGMAKEFRGEENAIGIRTKKGPDNSVEAFYTDDEYNKNCNKIKKDVNRIIEESKKYVGIWFTHSIGQGFAQLPTKAPKTYEFLKQEIARMVSILNNRNKKGY